MYNASRLLSMAPLSLFAHFTLECSADGMSVQGQDTDLLIYDRDSDVIHDDNKPAIPLTKNPEASRKRPAAAISAPSPGECVVCMDAAVSHVMIPCGHLCVCETCVAILRVNPSQTCPQCRTPVQSMLELFM